MRNLNSCLSLIKWTELIQREALLFLLNYYSVLEQYKKVKPNQPLIEIDSAFLIWRLVVLQDCQTVDYHCYQIISNGW